MAQKKKEKAKRLTPKQEVLRELYLKSGNICAFPDCDHPVMTTSGVYVANLCHIEAAEEGGPRFNKKQSNEDRRAYENLLLLCHRHHKETDNEDLYPVARMRELKCKHEKKFERVLDSMANEIYDLSKVHEPIPPTSLSLLVSGGFIDKKYQQEYEEDIKALIEKLEQISPATRRVYLLIVSRVGLDFGKMHLAEFRHLISIEDKDAVEHLGILDRLGIITDDEDQNFNERMLMVLGCIPTVDWSISLILREYCENKNHSLSDMLVELNFSSLND
tara:strand:+ start:65 stop:889 length:825 start_codon:yes stop_codon:yes gene_type:complete